MPKFLLPFFSTSNFFNDKENLSMYSSESNNFIKDKCTGGKEHITFLREMALTVTMF